MSLSINLTLVVQVVHFLIAYVIITKLFLRPGYEALKADEDRLRQLRGVITENQEQLASKQEYKRKRWQICQNYFYQHRPSVEVEKAGLRSLKALDRVPELTHAEVELMAHEISRTLKKKVLHD